MWGIIFFSVYKVQLFHDYIGLVRHNFVPNRKGVQCPIRPLIEKIVEGFPIMREILNC